MTATRRARRAAAVLAVALAVAGGACSSERERLGTGEDVGFCVAWSEWDGLEAPSPTDADELLDWAVASRNIVDRVDLRVEVGEKGPTSALLGHLRTVDDELGRFVDGVEAAGDDAAALRRASARLAAGGFDAAVAALVTAKEQTCTADERAGR